MRHLLIIIFVCLLLSSQSAKGSEVAFDIAQYHGKILYLDFWASWCIPCRKSFPWMNKLRAKYPNEQLAIVAINLDKEHSLATDFLKKYPANFEVKFDPKGNIAKQFQIPGMPSSLLFDANGKVLKVQSGFFNQKVPEYDKQIKQAIDSLKH